VQQIQQRPEEQKRRSTIATPQLILMLVLSVVFVILWIKLGIKALGDQESAIILGIVVAEFVGFGIWERVKRRTHAAARPDAPSEIKPPGARWIPTSRQWLVIWLSAILAALVILAGAIDDLPAEAMAAAIPLGLGALGVWHLETRRRG